MNRAAFLVAPALLLVALAGCSSAPDASAPTATGTSTSASASGTAVPIPACAGHRHATFAVVLPTGEGGALEVLDLAEPRHPSGHAYYQLGLAANMTVAVHMHQAGPEAGNASLQTTQMHYESPSTCATVAQSLAAIDVQATDSGLVVGGKHAAKGTYSATNEWPFSLHLQTQDTSTCAWEWHLVAETEGLAHVVAHGESFLVIAGAPTAEGLQALKEGLPAPPDRPGSCPPSG